jgi:hypothetical protein
MLVDVTAWASDGPDGMLAGFTVPVTIRDLRDAADSNHPSGLTRAQWVYGTDPSSIRR